MWGTGAGAAQFGCKWGGVGEELVRSWALDREQPLLTLGVFGCKPTLANFGQGASTGRRWLQVNLSEPSLFKKQKRGDGASWFTQMESPRLPALGVVGPRNQILQQSFPFLLFSSQAEQLPACLRVESADSLRQLEMGSITGTQRDLMEP